MTMTNELPNLEVIFRDCHARGFSVIPLAPNAKAPGDPLAGYLGCSSRSNNLDLLLHWAEEEPHFNGFICSDQNYTVLESDDFSTLQKYVGSVSLELFGKWHMIPDTLTGGRRPDRPHLFFRQTPETLAIKAAPGVPGVFEWRHAWLHTIDAAHPRTWGGPQQFFGQGVVAPGSIIDGKQYFWQNDIPAVDFPAWLISVLRRIKEGAKTKGGLVGRSGRLLVKEEISRKLQRVLKRYVRNGGLLTTPEHKGAYYDVEAALQREKFPWPEWQVDSRHPFLASVAGFLNCGSPPATYNLTESELAENLHLLNEKFCFEPRDSRHIDELARDYMRRPPSALPSGYLHGFKLYRDWDTFLEAIKATNKDK